MATGNVEPFVFGIYPGGIAGMESGPDSTVTLAQGKPDDPSAIHRALDLLQGTAELFIVRDYLHYEGSKTVDVQKEAVWFPQQYCHSTRKLDLVLCYHHGNYNQAEWQGYIKQVFNHYGPFLYCLQIGEEPNLYQYPGDGFFPQISQVIVDGIKFAKQEVRRRGLVCKVGFNAVPCFNTDDHFWNTLKPLVDESFLTALDYVGFDFFPDVFRRIDSEEALPKAIEAVLGHFRNVNLKTAGIPESTPIHISEHGWPTAPDRSEERQAKLIETVIRSIYALRKELHITQYELFALRDAASTNPNFFYQFGVLRDDYSPKLAFRVYQRLIAELG